MDASPGKTLSAEIERGLLVQLQADPQLPVASPTESVWQEQLHPLFNTQSPTLPERYVKTHCLLHNPAMMQILKNIRGHVLTVMRVVLELTMLSLVLALRDVVLQKH